MSGGDQDVRELLDLGRPDEALRRVDELLVECPEDLELLAMRVVCLDAVGQFELALDLGRVVLRRDPGLVEVSTIISAYDAPLAPPPFGPSEPRDRAYRSELPTALLKRLQQALHHQTYRGVQMVKNPFDILLYQQLLWDLRPATIIEIGSKAGGSALYLADQLATFGIEGRVLSFDLVPVTEVRHPLVTFAAGNGRRLGEVLSPEDVAGLPRPLMVIEDADHSYETTIATLRFFHEHLAAGDWIIVEDGNLSDIYPELYPEWSSGPHRALREFLRERGEDYRLAAELCDLYAYNGTTASNGFLERR